MSKYDMPTESSSDAKSARKASMQSRKKGEARDFGEQHDHDEDSVDELPFFGGTANDRSSLDSIMDEEYDKEERRERIKALKDKLNAPKVAKYFRPRLPERDDLQADSIRRARGRRDLGMEAKGDTNDAERTGEIARTLFNQLNDIVNKLKTQKAGWFSRVKFLDKVPEECDFETTGLEIQNEDGVEAYFQKKQNVLGLRLLAQYNVKMKDYRNAIQNYKSDGKAMRAMRRRIGVRPLREALRPSPTRVPRSKRTPPIDKSPLVSEFEDELVDARQRAENDVPGIDNEDNEKSAAYRKEMKDKPVVIYEREKQPDEDVELAWMKLRILVQKIKRINLDVDGSASFSPKFQGEAPDSFEGNMDGLEMWNRISIEKRLQQKGDERGLAMLREYDGLIAHYREELGNYREKEAEKKNAKRTTEHVPKDISISEEGWKQAREYASAMARGPGDIEQANRAEAIGIREKMNTPKRSTESTEVKRPKLEVVSDISPLPEVLDVSSEDWQDASERYFQKIQNLEKKLEVFQLTDEEKNILLQDDWFSEWVSQGFDVADVARKLAKGIEDNLKVSAINVDSSGNVSNVRKWSGSPLTKEHHSELALLKVYRKLLRQDDQLLAPKLVPKKLVVEKIDSRTSDLNKKQQQKANERYVGDVQNLDAALDVYGLSDGMKNLLLFDRSFVNFVAQGEDIQEAAKYQVIDIKERLRQQGVEIDDNDGSVTNPDFLEESDNHQALKSDVELLYAYIQLLKKGSPKFKIDPAFEVERKPGNVNRPLIEIKQRDAKITLSQLFEELGVSSEDRVNLYDNRFIDMMMKHPNDPRKAVQETIGVVKNTLLWKNFKLRADGLMDERSFSRAQNDADAILYKALRALSGKLTQKR